MLEDPSKDGIKVAQTKIVFLYEQSAVPPEIIQMAKEHVPSGFTFELLEEDSSADERLEKIGQADFLMGYPADLPPRSSARRLGLSCFRS